MWDLGVLELLAVSAGIVIDFAFAGQLLSSHRLVPGSFTQNKTSYGGDELFVILSVSDCRRSNNQYFS